MRKLATWWFLAASALPAAALAGAPSQNALQFAGGDDRVALSALPPFVSDLSQDFTITLWLRVDASATQRVFFAQLDTANFVSVLLAADHRPLLYVYRAGVVHSTSSPPLAPGVWTHMALRWNAAASTPEVLLDGVLQPSSAGGASSTGSNGVMMLGARSDGAQPFNGALDDVAIWGSLRSTAQIRAERLSTCIVGSGLQARYDFNVGTPQGNNVGLTTLPDAGTATFPGTLLNFALAGATSNWIASPVTRIAPALVFDPPLGTLVTGEDGSGYSGSLRLAVPPVEPVTVTLASSQPTEAQASAAQLVFTPDDWDQPQALSIAGVDDAVLDGDRAFTFTATSSSAESCQNGLGVVQAGSNIDDDSGSVGIAPALQAEGDGGAASMSFAVAYTGAPAPAFTVGYSTQDGTALAGTDYVAAEGALSFSGTPGEIRLVDVPVLGNPVAQANRSFTVALDPPSNPAVDLGQATAQGQIVDDDLDIRVLLDDGIGVVEPGQAVVYELVVTNLSPTLDAGWVPVSFVAVPLQDQVWSCLPSGGAACNGGADTFEQHALLPPGAQAIYTITGVVSPSLGTVGGPRQLVATAMAQADGDSQAGNDLAVDVDLAARIFADGFD